jgi:cyclohexa-1,5-dienecarbonyl-CoA hydratase
VAALVLPHVVGQAHADDIILTGRSIDGATAQSWGLVHTVDDNGDKALDRFIEKQILPKSAMALRYANRASRHYWRHKLDEELDGMERFYVDELMETHDANEGIASFLEKRKPEWKNR